VKRLHRRRTVVLLTGLAVVVLASAVAAYGAASRSSASTTLVIDNSFTIKTADPQRAFDPTAGIIDHAIYDSLFSYKGADLSNPIPWLVSTWHASANAQNFVFNLKKNVRFADGTPLTSADVVFSLRRLINLKGNPSFLLAGITMSTKGPYTVLMHSTTPNGALPAILANPSTGIVNSALVKKHGGNAGPAAAKLDKAENWLNTPGAGAGSGPYTLSQYSTTSQVTLVANPNYWGTTKPAMKTVVVRNMVAPTQLVNISRGSHEVAIDLSSDQAQTLKSNSKLSVSLQPSTWVFWLFANDDSTVSTVTSNKNFQTAVRYALDYPSIVGVAGPGAIQAPGIIPSMFLGSLPQKDKVVRDLTRAKNALAASGVGSQTVTLEYPSDLTINGVPFTTLAQKVQANLQQAGMNVTLSGSPTGTWLTNYRSGKMAFGLSLWGPDYADPADYLAFTPGNLVGLRAGWPNGSDPAIEKLAAQALVATNPVKRKALYQAIQQQLNQRGPYFPLIQPVQVFVHTTDLKGAVYNAVYTVDPLAISPK